MNVVILVVFTGMTLDVPRQVTTGTSPGAGLLVQGELAVLHCVTGCSSLVSLDSQSQESGPAVWLG